VITGQRWPSEVKNVRLYRREANARGGRKVLAQNLPLLSAVVPTTTTHVAVSMTGVTTRG
jgi:hypothetical protein